MTEIAPAPYPDDYKFNSIAFANYNPEVIDFTSSDLLKNYPADSYTTFQNLVFDIPQNIYQNSNSVGGYTYSIHVTAGSNIKPYGLNTVVDYIANINQMRIMFDLHSLEARDFIRVDGNEDVVDLTTPNNELAVLFKDRNIVKNIKVYVVKQRMGFDPYDIETAVKNGSKIIACENILPGEPLNIDIFNEQLHFDEQLKIYFRVMFDIPFLAVANNYFVNRHSFGNYEISLIE